MREYVDLKLIVPNSVEARVYQVALAESAVRASTMIVLPTGLGKTVVALLVIANRLQEDGRVIFLAPTKPLVEQHAEFLRSHLLAETTIFTGEIPPEKRMELWKQEQQAIVSTPQVIENDLKAGRITLAGVKLIIFDEAHRAVGNYAYRFIASRYIEQADDPLILGMTASPGGTVEKINEVSESLFIDNIEIRTESDPDVYPYTHEKNVEMLKFTLPPEMETIRQHLKQGATERLRKLIKMKVVFSEWVSTSELIKVQHKVATDRNYRAMSLVAEVIKLRHAIGLIETQGVVPTRKYFTRLIKQAQSKKGSKAARNLVSDDRIKAAVELSNRLDEIHPKLEALKGVVLQQLVLKPDSRVIVFTNYRDTAEIVRNTLNTLRDVRAEKFVGQAKKDGLKGLSQKEQVKLVSDFVNGTYNVLVATSVAEEGLDIPATDMVVFYEPIPSEIRSIQREGRTGRRRAGRVVVLITKGTRDEAYSSSSSRKKRMMSAEMKRLSTRRTLPAERIKVAAEKEPQESIDSTLPLKTDQTASYAQLETKCSFHAAENDATTTQIHSHHKTSGGTAGTIPEERQKTLLDFDSKEKNGSDTSVRIVADQGEVKSGDAIAEREQTGKKGTPALNGKKTSKTLQEQQEYVIAAIPSVGPVTARALLEFFGSLEAIFCAPIQELTKVRGVGTQTARAIHSLATTYYEALK
ncbi:MAG: helicase-related protein [Halobacteriota archaeon]